MDGGIEEMNKHWRTKKKTPKWKKCWKETIERSRQSRSEDLVIKKMIQHQLGILVIKAGLLAEPKHHLQHTGILFKN